MSHWVTYSILCNIVCRENKPIPFTDELTHVQENRCSISIYIPRWAFIINRMLLAVIIYCHLSTVRHYYPLRYIHVIWIGLHSKAKWQRYRQCELQCDICYPNTTCYILVAVYVQSWCGGGVTSWLFTSRFTWCTSFIYCCHSFQRLSSICNAMHHWLVSLLWCHSLPKISANSLRRQTGAVAVTRSVSRMPMRLESRALVHSPRCTAIAHVCYPDLGQLSASSESKETLHLRLKNKFNACVLFVYVIVIYNLLY